MVNYRRRNKQTLEKEEFLDFTTEIFLPQGSLDFVMINKYLLFGFSMYFFPFPNSILANMNDAQDRDTIDNHKNKWKL